MAKQTLEFVVVGEEKIHCAGCESRIGAALRRLSGVHEVRASAENQRVSVTFEPTQVAQDQLRAKLEQLGYQVR